MRSPLCVDVATNSPRWAETLPVAENLAERAAEAAWQRADHNEVDAEVSIVLGDDALIRDLNNRYREQDKSTNVLSFPADDGESCGLPRLLGDVILSCETIGREAQEQGKSIEHHFLHLCVHGVLHLLGYDHETDADAMAMETLEIAVLQSLDVGNPYEVNNAEMKTPA